LSIPFGVAIPFVEQVLGLTLEAFADGASTLHFRPRPEHCNSFSVVHGGVVMTLLDVAMATAARSVRRDVGVVTIEMKTSFMRPTPARSGATGGDSGGDTDSGALIVGQGRLLHYTRNIAFTEGRVFDAHGNLCAMATGTFRYVPRAVERPMVTD
jgi:uncharacterized protein (TIGR00369 family)